jgi:hypothetical protein
MELAGTREGGRGACKSDDIWTTPMRTAVTHFNKQQSKRGQDAPKKLQSAMKRDLKIILVQARYHLSRQRQETQSRRWYKVVTSKADLLWGREEIKQEQ